MASDMFDVTIIIWEKMPPPPSHSITAKKQKAKKKASKFLVTIWQYTGNCQRRCRLKHLHQEDNILALFHFFFCLKCLAVTGNQTQDRVLNAQALCHWATTTSQQPIQFCIYTVKGCCYATVSLSTDQQKF